MIRVGNVKVVAISDLDLPPRVALDEIWPNVAERDWLPFQQRFPRVFGDEGRWHNHVGCFLIQTRNALMLVDTGIGPMIGGTLLDKLTALGVAPSDIDTVFLTHLHIDHVGGALTKAGVPTFPRARYVLHRAEWDARAQHAARAESLGQPPYVDRIVTPLADLGVLDLVDGEHALAPDITAIPTPGHSPGHMSVIVASDGERAIVLGDVLLHPA